MARTPPETAAPKGTLRNWLTDRTLRGLIGLALLLPYRVRVPLMGWLAAHVAGPLAGWPKRIRENLALVLPDLPRAEVDRLCRAVPDNFGRTLIEIYSGADFVVRARNATFTGPGLEALERARQEGRPVILNTGHFGNYDAARAALIARGHNMGALYRAMSNPYFNDHYVKAISAIGTPMFEQGKRGMIEMVRHVKSGGVLGILTDLHAPGRPRLSYFGKPVSTSTVTAELALKFNAELIPVYAVRKDNGLDFEIVVQAPIPHSDPETMAQAVNDGLEALVREHMDQWFWIHRRWKAAQKLARQAARQARNG
ncbi:lysophospholipid acyltransferase family protein [Aestuariicoccus sp. MJ-SS9]|uniref:lysophospholipid acyltransferase family protein n=1 Tax=Aestuariicoccus sp. MJ-SS9 TaxID=3079855 RepID=UPI002912F26E|nr:lysophospholipid acyltransferase family protein [Aestuariicoccus sp. MJ-SS9]MDU8913626.1 lysophospholipid acyltransferase family protein [Aestuariicoccus sp. MJ-SS9]